MAWLSNKIESFVRTIPKMCNSSCDADWGARVIELIANEELYGLWVTFHGSEDYEKNPNGFVEWLYQR